MAEPSDSDRMLTQDLIAASRPLGLKVPDHVIVGEETTLNQQNPKVYMPVTEHTINDTLAEVLRTKRRL